MDVDDGIVVALEKVTDGCRRSRSSATQAVSSSIPEGNDNVPRLTKLGLELLNEPRFAALLLPVGVETLFAMECVLWW